MATLKDYLISGKFNGEVSINGMKMTLKDMLISAKLSGGGEPPEPGPLYPLPNMGPTQFPSSLCEFIAPNRVSWETNANSRTMYFNADGVMDTSNTNYPWFSLASGDAYTIKLKNIVHNNEDPENYLAVALKDRNGTTRASTGNQSIPANADMPDVEVSGTVVTDVANVALFAFIYRPVNISFDVEIYINGVRYL